MEKPEAQTLRERIRMEREEKENIGDEKDKSRVRRLCYMNL